MPLPGLTPKPAYAMSVLTATGRRCFHRPSVPADRVVALLTDWIACVGWPNQTIMIDGEDFTAEARATPAIIREVARRRGQPVPPVETDETRVPGDLDTTSAWRFLLTKENVLHRLPLAGQAEGDPEFRGGPGPGGLTWLPIADHGVLGLGAAHRGGTFKILRLGSDRCALFFERGPGDWEAIATGCVGVLKERASARANRPTPRVDYEALSQLFVPGGGRR